MALREVFARFTTSFDARALVAGGAAVNATTAALQRLGGILAGGALFYGVSRFVRSSVELGDELDKSSKTLGISTQALQAWRHAAELSGVNQEQMNGSLVRFQRSAYDASRGVKTAQDAFRALGVTVKDSNGELKPMEQLLLEMADPLSQLESGTERTAILATLLGRSGARLGPLFLQGREGVNALLQDFEALGGGATPEFIQAAADLQDAQARLGVSTLSLRSRLGTFLLPAVQRMVDGLSEMIVGFSEAVKDTKLLEAASKVLAGAMAALGIKMLIAFAPALIVIGAVTIAVGALVLVVDDFLVTLAGGDSVIGRSTQSLMEWTEEAKAAGGITGALATTFDILGEAIEKALDALGDFFGFGPERDSDAAAEVERLTGGVIKPGTTEGDRALRRIADGANPVDVARDIQARRAISPALEGGPLAGFDSAREALIRASFGTGVAGAPAAPVRNQTNNININGAQDPAATAREVTRQLDRQSRRLVEDTEGGGA